MPTINQDIDRFRQFIGRVAALPVLVFVIFGAVLIWQILSLLSAYKLVDTSDLTISQADYTLKLLVDEETGQRGYLVGGDPVFLQPYNQALGKVGPSIDSLTILVGNSEPQRVHIQELVRLYGLWQREADLENKIHDQNPSSTAYQAYFNQAHGKDLMDAIRVQIGEIVSISRARRDQRVNEVQHEAIATIVIVVSGALVLGAFLGVSSVLQIRRVTAVYEDALRAEHRNAQLFSTTLLSMGDAVLVTNAYGGITQMNAIAEQLTGWKLEEALGQPSSVVFHILNETTRARVTSPVDRVIAEGVIVGLANHTVLVHRDGHDVPIDDSGAPIRDDEGNLIGTVLVFRDITERKQLEEEREMARALAERRAADLAIQYDREHRIADSLQRSLLEKPASDAFARVEFETFYRPAWNEAQVGGDFYDLFELEGGRIAMVVGDISGKGLEAAAKTAEIKFTLRAYMREYPQVSSAMVRLNEFLCESQTLSGDPTTYFLCLALALIDPATGELSVATSGAESPIIVRNDLVAEEAPTGGMPLGIISKLEYVSAGLTMNQGDLLVIATDGITEARPAGGEFLGMNGLSAILTRGGISGSLADIGEAILEHAAEHAGGALKDDACILLARLR
jgi:PAS domain S-box-containing protein